MYIKYNEKKDNKVISIEKKNCSAQKTQCFMITNIVFKDEYTVS